MAKIRAIKLEGHDVTTYTFYCPGCDCAHNVNSTWKFNEDLDNPTFKPSIFVNKPGDFHTDTMPICHSFIKDGKIKYLKDCSHELAGQTVELPLTDEWFNKGFIS